jgi:hypothetical protein
MVTSRSAHPRAATTNSSAILEPVAGYDPATYGLRSLGGQLQQGESSRIDGEPSASAAHPRASSRIDAHAFVDAISLDLIGAHAQWIVRRDPAELRLALLELLIKLER